jgi:hypothetical protein
MPITKVAVSDRFPALKWYPQQDAWVRDPSRSDNLCFNYPLPLRLQGTLKAESLRKAFEEIVQRHEVFRSVFSIEDGVLVQNVLGSLPFSLSTVDLAPVSQIERQMLAQELAKRDAHRPFDLGHEPLLRATVLHMSADDHILLLTTHHFACDDWSAEILVGELAELYSAFSCGRPSRLPTIKYRYSDFVMQQAKGMRQAELNVQLDYWQKQYHGVDPFYYVDPDRPRATALVGDGALEEVMLPGELDDAIAQFSRQNGFSGVMAYVGAVLCLFRCYSGKEDVGAGICVANRNHEEAEETIGPLSNRLLLRVALPAAISMREVLERVRLASWEAYSFQDIPYGEVLEKAASGRKSNHSRLFQGLIAFNNAPKRSREFSGLKVSRFVFDPGIACCDFYICFRYESGLRMTIQYDAGLFNRETVKQIMNDYQHILGTMISRPETLVGDVRVSRRVPAATDSSGNSCSR